MEMSLAPVWEELSCFQLDQHDVEYCRTHQQYNVGDYFYIQVRVKRQICILLHPEIPSSLLLLGSLSSESESVSSMMSVSCDELRGLGLSDIERNLSACLIIPPEFIPPLASIVFASANELVQNCPPGFSYESPHFSCYKFVLNILVPELYENESLKKVKLEEGAAMESCSICLIEFGDGALEVLSTPCKHVFHQDCLVQWLNTSPTCPLCRDSMFTSSN